MLNGDTELLDRADHLEAIARRQFAWRTGQIVPGNRTADVTSPDGTDSGSEVEPTVEPVEPGATEEEDD